MSNSDYSYKERDNYFLLLDLDPSEDNWEVIRVRLQACIRNWSNLITKGSNAQQKASKAKLKLVKDIEKVMSDPAERAREAENARREQHKLKLAAQNELESLIGILRLKGYCSTEHLVKIVKDLKGQITEAEVRNTLKASGIEIREGNRGDDTAKTKQYPRLERAIQRDIRHNLDILGFDDLYSFLKLDRNSSIETLRKKADEINKEILRRGSTDLRSNARKELAGAAMSLFQSKDGRQKYENTLKTEALEKLHGQINSAGHDGIIGNKALQYLLQEAKKIGVNSDIANAYIVDYAAARLWIVAEVTETDTQPLKKQQSLRMCPFCGTLATDPDAKVCSSCGELLVIQCPKCGREHLSRNKFCAKCAFDFSELASIRIHMQEAREKADKGLLKEAREYCDYIEKKLPEYQDAKKLSHFLDKKEAELEAGKNELASLIHSKEWDKARKTLEQLKDKLPADKYERFIEDIRQGRYVSIKTELDSIIESKNLFEAEKRLEQIKNKLEKSDYNNFLEQINLGIKEANGYYKQFANRIKNSSSIDLINKGLAVCRDHPEFLLAAEKYPPSAPTNLRAQLIQKKVELKWDQPKKQNKSLHLLPRGYTIIRQESRPPHNETDGKCIYGKDDEAETQTEFTDNSIEPGIKYYYGVFTKASLGSKIIFSEEYANHNNPIFLAEPVTDVDYIPDDQSVKIFWKRPKNSNRVLILKYDKQNKIAKYETNLWYKDNGAKNGGLIAGENYKYVLIALYPNQQFGKELEDNPRVVINAIPESAPPITEVQAKYESGYVYLTYFPTKDCRLTFYRGEGAIPEELKSSTGDSKVGKIKKLGEKCELLNNEELEDGDIKSKVEVTPNDSGLYWFACITKGIKRESASKLVEVIALESVKDLEVIALDKPGEIEVLWNWPEGIEAAILTWNRTNDSNGDMASEMEDNSIRIEKDGDSNKSIGKIEVLINFFRSIGSGKANESNIDPNIACRRINGLDEGLFTITVYSESANGKAQSEQGISTKIYTGQRDEVRYSFQKLHSSRKIKMQLKGRSRTPISKCMIRYRTDKFPESIIDGDRLFELPNLNPKETYEIAIPMNVKDTVYIAAFIVNEALSKVRLIPENPSSPIRL